MLSAVTWDIDPYCCLGVARTTVSGLRVRKEPTLDAPVIRLLARNEAVDVWGRVGAWYLVQDATGVTGWSHVDFLPLDEGYYARSQTR